MRSKPLIDALKVESMEAQRKRPHVISFLELQQTNGAVHGGGWSFPHRGGRRKALPGARGGGVEKQRQSFDNRLI